METSFSLLSYYILLNQFFFFFFLIEKNFLVSARELARENHVIDVKSLLPSNSCSMPDKSMRPFKLKVVHRHGQCSSKALQDKPSLLELLHGDQDRVDYIHHRAANSTAILKPIKSSRSTEVPINIGSALQTDYYIVIVEIGDPAQSFSIILDISSDVTWTQCVPCYSCYRQNDPFYDPSKSSRFTNIPCAIRTCTELKHFGCSSTNNCLYYIYYGDGSYSMGTYLQDALKIGVDTIYNFSLGCGQNNKGQYGLADGVLGLGRGDVSVISQTAHIYKKVFSYCLPSGTNKQGYLLIGSSAPDVKYIRMLTHPNLPSTYFINLTGISVGGARLNISPTIFTIPGTMLDSGTVISRLPPTAYSALRNNFRQHMTKYPMAPPFGLLDTCYDLTNFTIIDIPKIDLIFGDELVIPLDGTGIIYALTISQMCLGFTGNDNDNKVGIIGNVQQRRINVVINSELLVIGFGANGCS